MSFNEDTRVKIPSLLHLTRLGYTYLSLKNAEWDTDTNIFPALFNDSISRINPDLKPEEVKRLREDTALLLDNEDLGKAFYEKLIERSGIRLIDFEKFDNNSFHVVTELPCKKGDDVFRPDITLLINGMPLVFIEVKKPNNRGGVIAESDRMEDCRFQNKNFRRFINITQLMLFSNNMEYDDDTPEPIQGAFYATTSYEKAVFNYFREEDENVQDGAGLLQPEDAEVEHAVLQDNNCLSILGSNEFATNKSPHTPTNRLCTSLLSRERLAFLLQYALVYVDEEDGLQKHVMRYPQLFATKAIEKKLDDGGRKGIIWHTQGSGKTALTFFSLRYLVDYFQNQQVIPKFYFIVDRLDLLQQASREFSSRGLVVHTISSREAFAQDIKQTTAIHNDSGKLEITLVNIQKFKDDPAVVAVKDYSVEIQRVYFLDEVHRSYDPKGSFLANLEQSDKNAIKIGLTGTPLLGNDYDSKALFGDYIHKYYYNKSIADGYTLRLIREAIETNYQLALQEALAKVEVEKGNVSMKSILADSRFVEPMLKYIISDFEQGRLSDSSIGGMVICDSSEQAKEMYGQFKRDYALDSAAEAPAGYGVMQFENKAKTAALILHDVGSKDERKDWVDDFKAGKIDLLFVYNMLLTGFDAKRLKKLYVGRVIRNHNLLQALTRVNRTYGKHQYGYVVDFADIRSEFDKTNKAYFDELQNEVGDEMEHYSDLFKSSEEIAEELEAVKDALFQYDTLNKEVFSQQIEQIQDRSQVQALKKALSDARSLYNLCRLFGYEELTQRLPFGLIKTLYNEVDNHLAKLNLKDRLENQADTSGLLNMALEEVIFQFKKIGEEELKLADELKETLRRTRETMTDNFDPQDPEFIELREELERLFKNRKLSEVSQEDMQRNMEELHAIQDGVREINRKNRLLQDKYSGDAKLVRVHKRLVEEGSIADNERHIFEALQVVKQNADTQVFQNRNMLANESYFERMMKRSVAQQFKADQFNLNASGRNHINHLLVKEYLNEYNGVSPW